MTLPIQLPEFQGRAACAEVGGDEWFPEKGGTPRPAKQVCAACEIQAECLQWALATNELHGVWGGLTRQERTRLTRPRQVLPIRHGTAGGYRTHVRRGETPCGSCIEANNLKRHEQAATRAATQSRRSA